MIFLLPKQSVVYSIICFLPLFCFLVEMELSSNCLRPVPDPFFCPANAQWLTAGYIQALGCCASIEFGTVPKSI